MPEAEIQKDAAAAFDVPRHVAIIMDGNGPLGGGAWITASGRSSARGGGLAANHRAAGEIGIKIVTIFPSALKTGLGPRAKSAS